MTDIRIEKENGELHPFQEDVDVCNFYGGGQRSEILGEILSGVRRGVPVIILSGEGGSGKTMICRMLEQRLAGDVEVMIFPKTVESFDDVMRKIALRFGIDVKVHADRKKSENYLGQIIEYLRQAERPVLIVFDEAENLYLATLERIRKMQDRVTAEGAKLLLMFSGRKTFLENNEQLSICEFVNSEELRLTLPSLEEEEVADYLQHGLERLNVDDVTVSAILENIPAITEKSDGNFAQLNLLARDLLDSGSDADASIVTTLENVEMEHVEPEEKTASVKIPGGSAVSALRRYVPYIVGGVLVILIAVWFWPGGDKADEEQVESTVSQTETIASLPAETLNSPEKSDTASADVTQEANDEVAEVASQQQEVAAENSIATEGSQVDAGQQVTQVAQPVVEAEKNVSEEQQQPVAVEEGKAEAAEQVVSAAEPDETVLETPDEGTDGKEIKKPAKSKIVILTAGDSLKRKPANAEQNTSGTEADAVSEVQEVIAANAHFTVEQLYQKRFQAGVEWKVGERNDMYTVQLMVLTSKNSEQNLKQMLATDEYRQEAGNFFIFRKRSAPDVIFVFYGEYPTMSFARLAMNSLPKFLQKHKPYAISIKGAMAKVSR